MTIRGENFINQALQKTSCRTLEGIKGKRRNVAYKALVAEYMIEEVKTITEEDENQPPQPQEFDNTKREIANALKGNKHTNKDLREREHLLDEICKNIGTWDEGRSLEELSLYVRTLLPGYDKTTKDGKGIAQSTRTLTKRKQRRVDYAKTQKLWLKNRGLCIRTILKDVHTNNPPPLDLLWDFWKTTMTQRPEGIPSIEKKGTKINSLWSPITVDEVRRALPANSTAPGPDGLMARDLKKVPLSTLSRVFNICLYLGKTPAQWLESKTTLIPKVEGAEKPEEFRPITVSSVLVRTFHKVLANRMLRAFKLDERQKAFREIDGCAENIFLLDMALKFHKRNFKHLYLASMDVAKAFDSVSHEAIHKALASVGAPDALLKYVEFLYNGSRTRLSFAGQTSPIIKPTCGVKQGDPMSPILFNCVIDQLIKKVPNEIGAQLPGGQHLNILAFADDIVLAASTPTGLQKLIDTSTEYLQSCGLRINTRKSHTVTLKNVPHVKRSVVDAATTFTCGGHSLKALKSTEQWRYLGVKFAPNGTVRVDVKEELNVLMQKLSRAPMKPQQRLYALRTTLLPSVYHRLMLGEVRVSTLKDYDRLTRRYVRKWLNLPHDTAVAYIHAPIKEGGLGIPSLRWNIPVMRLSRLRKIAAHNNSNFLQDEIKLTSSRLEEKDQVLRTSKEVSRRWAALLHQMIDGKCLEESSKVPKQHLWVGDGTRFLSGSDFIHFIKMRINALPVRARTSRGRRKETVCRAGCPNVETLNHVLQQCHRTHDSRIKRHNAVNSYILRNIKNLGYETHEEPRLKVGDAVRKPDCVAVKGDKAIVIDTQVVSEQADLKKAHMNKINYYKPLENTIRETYNVKTVDLTSVTLTWRGIWSKDSYEALVSKGFLKPEEAKIVSVRALLGGYAAFCTFNRRTTTRRTGVG